MNEQENRRAAERFIDALRSGNADMIAEVLHDDYAEEYPQSGERIRGKQNWISMMHNYPGMPKARDHNIQVCGDLGIGEVVLEYPNGQTYMSCSVFEFKDGKIIRARSYFGEPFEAPAWRSQWVEKKAA